MLDPTQDYAKRIKEFDARLADAKSNAIQTLLQKARSATSDAAETVVELSRLAERFRPFAEQQFSEVHSNIKVSVKNAAQLSANLDRLIQDPTIDAPIKKSLAFVTYQAIVSSKATAQAQLATADLISHSFSIVVNVLVDTLSTKIFRPDYRIFYAKAAREGIQYAIGLIPVIGDAASTIQAILSILSAANDQFEEADKYSTYLEEYTATVELWCEATRTIISLYDGYLTSLGSDA